MQQRRSEDIQWMLLQMIVALGITSVLSVAFGWLMAGRVLRPIRLMNSTVQEISAHNLHDRLGFAGPQDELKRLADTVDGLLERLETAFEAQKRFVANAAHELRTPMTLERALLEEQLTDTNASLESFRETFQRLLANSENQGRLLEALLTLASSERGLDHREPVSLSELAERVALAANVRGEGLALALSIEPAETTGDPALIERLVANLVDNATRYNVPGGRIAISTSVTEDDAVLSVVNTGPVVPVEQVDRLLEPFQRLGRDRTERDDGHHGLGLSIVRAIAGAHAADLRVVPEPAGGLRVEVRFPARLPAVAHETSPAQTPAE